MGAVMPTEQHLNAAVSSVPPSKMRDCVCSVFTFSASDPSRVLQTKWLSRADDRGCSTPLTPMTESNHPLSCRATPTQNHMSTVVVSKNP